ncbi:MAG: hypothetical protein F4X99_17335 [Gammaproteobacteria bacterium]|nr:hypothetical protein [Gammaproteobacteria bacterium]
MLVSVSSTQTVEAATIEFAADDADNAVTAAPGDTVNVAVASAFANVSILGTADGVGASFVANGGQSIQCSDDGSCDVDDRDPAATGRQNVASAVSVALKIDADSGEGHILLSVGGLGATVTNKVITVSKAGLVGSLEIKTDSASDNTIGSSGTSNLTVTVKNASTPPGGLDDQTVTVITTHGTVGCGEGAGTASAGTTQTCSAPTDAAGVVDVVLTGGGVEGTATVTATLGTRTDQATVTLFGSAKNLTAVPGQGSVEIGESVYIVLTVTDGAGNPVSGAMVVAGTPNEVVGPGDKPVKVVTEQNTPLDGDSPIGRGYSKDKPAVGKAAAIPACGDDNTDTDSETGGLQELFGPNDGTGDDGEGTNSKGQCVVYVTAPEDTTDATKSATRGPHTLHFAVSGATTVKASATIEVAGKPASITTDAPERVDLASVTKVTVSVFDDEDVLVGDRDVNIRKVGGDGLVEDAQTSTTNGKATFNFIAPSTPGSSEILVTAGDVNHRVTLTIGDAMEEPDEPVMEDPHAGEPELTGNAPLMIYSGGSVDELAHASEHTCPGGATIWVHDGSSWQVYSTDAPAIANIGFTTAFADGLEMQAVWVSRCEADAMDSEGMESGNGMEESG